MTYNRIIQGQTGRKRKEGRREKKRLFRSFLKKKGRRRKTISDGQGGGIFRWLLTESYRCRIRPLACKNSVTSLRAYCLE